MVEFLAALTEPCRTFGRRMRTLSNLFSLKILITLSIAEYSHFDIFKCKFDCGIVVLFAYYAGFCSHAESHSQNGQFDSKPRMERRSLIHHARFYHRENKTSSLTAKIICILIRNAKPV